MQIFSFFEVLFVFFLQACGIMVQNEDSNHKCSNYDMEQDGESKATKIEVGDNFVVIANELGNGDPFFVILCDHVLHQCKAPFQNEWNNIWYKGDMLLGGIWYHCIPRQKGQLTS